MPNYNEYRKSISRELISIKDRVRHFIDDHHWGEDGRYKEIILMEILKNVLPHNIGVSTGFVMGGPDQISSQIDIIIHDNDYPVLFKIADFAVIAKESVFGIIEVKSKIKTSNIQETIQRCHTNGQIIGNHIFNGIFAYETGFTIGRTTLPDSIRDSLSNNIGFLNNICFGKDFFMKYWSDGNPQDRIEDNRRSFSFYKIKELAFGYFISNLIEDVYIQKNNKLIGGTLSECLYPIEGTKETQRLREIEIKVD